VPGGLLPIAINNCRNSSAVCVGKPLKECATTSVVAPPGSANFNAIPRGVANASASAIVGIPAKSENRTVTGTDPPLKCAALLSDFADAAGVNVPSRTIPFAWIARPVVCLPKTPLRASTKPTGLLAGTSATARDAMPPLSDSAAASMPTH